MSPFTVTVSNLEEQKCGNTLINNTQDGSVPELQPFVVFGFHSEAQFEEKRLVKFSEMQPGQLVAGI